MPVSARDAVTRILRHWRAAALGMAACLLILLATRSLGGELRVFTMMGAAAAIGLWLLTADVRREAFSFAASSTLALLPLAALQAGWIEIEDREMALLAEAFCLAVLFVSALEPLARSGMAALRQALDVAAAGPVPVGAARARAVAMCGGLVVFGLVVVPGLAMAVLHRVAVV
jgi:hypothetical protein